MCERIADLAIQIGGRAIQRVINRVLGELEARHVVAEEALDVASLQVAAKVRASAIEHARHREADAIGGDALVYYGIAGLLLAAIGTAVFVVATVRLNGAADRVEATADVSILLPVDRRQASGRVLLDVVNRGNTVTVPNMNRATRPVFGPDSDPILVDTGASHPEILERLGMTGIVTKEMTIRRQLAQPGGPEAAATTAEPGASTAANDSDPGQATVIWPGGPEESPDQTVRAPAGERAAGP